MDDQGRHALPAHLSALIDDCLSADASQVGPVVLMVLTASLIFRIASSIISAQEDDYCYSAKHSEKLHAERLPERTEELQPEKLSERRPAEAGENTSQPHCLRGTFLPPMGALVTSNAEPYPFENENCTGELLALCRPTYDKALDKSGNYPYSDHFQNRRRNWEIRVNFRVKHTVTDTLRFGVQLDQYAPVDPASRRIMGVVVAALRNVVGNAIYHSVGDDPRYTEGPLEQPTFVMPLWAFDQFIETPDGEEAPSLMDPNFVNLGVRRSTDRSAFIRRMHNLKMEPGFTYTFAFWGISHIMSVLDWKIRGVLPGWPIDFNKFCKAPPVGVVLYALKPDVPGEEAEHRHLESRKNYYFNMAFWSTMAPPSEDRLRQIEDQNNSSPAGKPAASPCTGEPLQAVAERKRAPAARRRQVPGWMCMCGS